MKNEEVIDRILQFHPDIPDYDGCDGYKSGNPSDECTGVVSALVPTVDVIRKTAELGCNLLVTHERSIIRPRITLNGRENLKIGFMMRKSFAGALWDHRVEESRPYPCPPAGSDFQRSCEISGWEAYVAESPERDPSILRLRDTACYGAGTGRIIDGQAGNERNPVCGEDPGM